MSHKTFLFLKYFQSVMVDRFDRRMSVGGGQRYPVGPQYNTSNAIYGSNPNNPVYGHHHGQYGPGAGSNSSHGGQYGAGGYLLGYERAAAAGGQASRLREVETVSASSGSVNTRRRSSRGALEQVNEGESTDSRGEEESRSLTRRQERHRTNSRLGSRDPGSSVRRGSVVSQQRHESVVTRPGSRVTAPPAGNTFNRPAGHVPDRKSASPTFSGDETDKDFQFVGGSGGPSDKTLKYDTKNFSFRLKNRDSVVVSESRGTCSWRHVCCNTLYLCLAITVLVFVIMLLSTSPHNYR